MLRCESGNSFDKFILKLDMIRLLLLLLILSISGIIIYVVIKLFASSLCANCDGLGYWEGTRGEKNTCKVCGGTGKK